MFRDNNSYISLMSIKNWGQWVNILTQSALALIPFVQMATVKY